MNMIAKTPAAASVVAVAAAPSLALAVSSDPVFQALERHRNALAQVEAVVAENGAIEKRWLEEKKTLTPSIVLCTREQWEASPKKPFPWPFDGHDEFRLESAKDIERLFGNDPEDRTLARTKLAAIKREHRKTFGPINARVEAAYAAEFERREELSTTAPTTAAGIRTLLLYVQQEEETCGGSFFDDDQRLGFYGALGRAVTALTA